MVAWIALVVSVISLLVNIVVQRDKLKSALDDFGKWRKDRKEIRAISKYAKKIGRPKNYTDVSIALRRSLFFFNLSVSIISSSILGITADQMPVSVKLFLITLTIYVISSAIPVIAFLVSIKRFSLRSFSFIFPITFGFGALWSLLTLLLIYNGLPTFYAGFNAAVINSMMDTAAILLPGLNRSSK
jgi:hypothetical protein